MWRGKRGGFICKRSHVTTWTGIRVAIVAICMVLQIMSIVLQDQWMPLLHIWPISNVTCFSSKHRYYTYRMFYKYILSQLHISTGLSSCTRREYSHWIWIHVGCELYVQSVVSSYVRLARYSRKAATQREAELCGLSTHQCHYFQQTGLAEIASQTPVKYRNQ